MIEDIRKNNVYIYDGSFEGFLCAVFRAWNDKLLKNICCEQRYEPEFADVDFHVFAEIKKFERVQTWIIENFGYVVSLKIYRVFLTESTGCELSIFNYLKYLHHNGKFFRNNYVNSVVMAVDKLERAFCNETHHLYGFLRFKESVDGVLYSEICPKYNQLEPLAVFFHDRLQGKSFIIHDTERKLSAVCNGKYWYITSVTEKRGADCRENQDAFESMWKRYLDVLTIKERENYALQRQMLPIRHRKNMTEFQL